MTVAEGIIFGVMVVFSVFDLRKKQVNLALLIPFGIAAVLWRIYQETGIWVLLAGLLPGAGCLLLSYVTEESIGKGDGFVLCVLGVLCGLKVTLAAFGTGLVFAAVWAMLLLIIKRAGRKTELPFLPCLSLGYFFCALG